VQFIVTKEDTFIRFSSRMKEQYFRLDIAKQPTALGDPAYAQRNGQLRRWLIEELTGREEGFTDGKVLQRVVHPPVISAELRQKNNL